MIFRRFALSGAVIIAMGTDAFYHVTFVSAAAEDGQLAFNNVCRTCHALGEGDNRLGPSLHFVPYHRVDFSIFSEGGFSLVDITNRKQRTIMPVLAGVAAVAVESVAVLVFAGTGPGANRLMATLLA